MSLGSSRHRFREHVLRFLGCLAVLYILFPVAISAQSLDSDGSSSSASDLVSGTDPDPLAVATALPDSPSQTLASQESSSRQAANALVPFASPSFTPPKSDTFNLKGAFIQTFNENLFFHLWRVGFDPGLRYNVAHKPFWHDYAASFKGYDMSNWGDGDDFVVNDIGHPLEGAVFARTFLQNSPRSNVVIGKNREYWMSRLKAMGWATAWSTQLELGPVSETSLGNQGGFTYVPGCGVWLSCLNNPQYHKPPTTNTGWTDFIVTPVIGTAWVIGEDTIDKYVVAPIAVNHRIFGGRILRSALEPSRSFAAIFAGKFPWELPAPENNFVSSTPRRMQKQPTPDLRPPVDHWEIGFQYSNLSLPVLSNECTGGSCRKNLSGTGFNFDYNFTRGIGFDSTMNFMPGQQGSKAVLEGLFGLKMGARFQKVGVFGKVRPGFIYYQDAKQGGGNMTPNSLTRFATDLGGVFEYYPKENSILRFDVGTTVVRYLSDHPDPKPFPIGSTLSTQYWVTQGNLQVSTSYTYRF